MLTSITWRLLILCSTRLISPLKKKCSEPFSTWILVSQADEDLRGQPISRHIDFLIVVLLQRADVRDFNDSAFADNAHPRAKPLHLAQDVRGEEYRHAALILGANHVEEFTLHERIESGGWLVEEEQLGAVQQALDNAHLFLVAGKGR